MSGGNPGISGSECWDNSLLLLLLLFNMRWCVSILVIVVYKIYQGINTHVQIIYKLPYLARNKLLRHYCAKWGRAKPVLKFQLSLDIFITFFFFYISITFPLGTNFSLPDCHYLTHTPRKLLYDNGKYYIQISGELIHSTCTSTSSTITMPSCMVCLTLLSHYHV